MKKILIALLIALLFGCSLSNTPSSKVETYLDNYINLSDEVLSDLDVTIKNENLNTENENIYKEVLTRQYKNLKYEIEDESIDGDNASVSVKITVYDLYKSGNSSILYINEHLEEFNNESNEYDSNLAMNYKLSEMLKTSDTVDYEITFKLTKQNGEWVISEPNRETLEKIHGLYNYSND